MTGIRRVLEQHLIPYHNAEGFFIPERELAKIVRYYNFRKLGFGTKESFANFCTRYDIKDINDDFTSSNLIVTEKKYIYSRYVERFGIDLLNEISRKEPFLLLSTTHRVKGGEADYVAVFMDCTRKVMNNLYTNIDEELRVLYVACTRSRIGLYLVRTSSSFGMDKIIDLVREQVA